MVIRKTMAYISFIKGSGSEKAGPLAPMAEDLEIPIYAGATVLTSMAASLVAGASLMLF